MNQYTLTNRTNTQDGEQNQIQNILYGHTAPRRESAFFEIIESKHEQLRFNSEISLLQTYFIFVLFEGSTIRLTKHCGNKWLLISNRILLNTLGYPERCRNHCFRFNCIGCIILCYFSLKKGSSLIWKIILVVFNF